MKTLKKKTVLSKLPGWRKLSKKDKAELKKFKKFLALRSKMGDSLKAYEEIYEG